LQTDYFNSMKEMFNPLKIQDKPEALKGIRVLDLSHMIFGPTAAKVLAQFGAEVIKIELPFYGDYWRGSTFWGKYWKHSNPLWHFINHSKYFVAIDVKKPKGKELILRLAEISDVVIENFASGTVEAWGIGYTQVSEKNPRVIYAHCSTFGQFGPSRFQPGWDLLAQGASGVLSLTGHPENENRYKIPDYYGDFYPGHFTAMFILAALNYREKSGKGQCLDMAQAEILIRELFNFTYINAFGEDIGVSGNADPTMAPSGIYKTAEGTFIALAVGTDSQFEALCNAMGRNDLLKQDRFKKALDRLKHKNAKELNNIVTEWVSSKKVSEIIVLAGQYGFPASEVMDDLKISNDEWRQERGSVVNFNDEMYGKLVLAGPPAMLSKTPGRIKWLTRPIGYHNRYVLKRLLGISEKDIRKLEKERVIGHWDYKVGTRPPIYYDIQNDPIFNYREGSEGNENEK
jgi:crotonobetainyl-CoA:carnitine CoA-transferase CaiB-like acyl-CoA transferase